MKTVGRAIAAVLALVVLFAVWGSLAGAVKSTQGDDYSEDISSTHIEICDMESDKTKVKSVADNDKLN